MQIIWGSKVNSNITNIDSIDTISDKFVEMINESLIIGVFPKTLKSLNGGIQS